MTNPPDILFYIPEDQLQNRSIPRNIEAFWDHPDPSLKEGKFIWTLQTYLFLRAANFPCRLGSVMEDRGIIVSHRDFLPSRVLPKKNQLLICIKADRDVHPFAQIHIVQNPQDTLDTPAFEHLWKRHCITHWPQGGLIPRAPARGDAFENVAYFGVRDELAEYLRNPEWENRLHQMGLQWHAVLENEKWRDYSFVDAIVAARNPASNFNHKPPSKLHNAWRTGIPAVLGAESAYRSERRGPLDFIEIDSLETAIGALRQLQSDKNLRIAMAENGRRRAEDITPQRITDQWRSFFDHMAIPAYFDWQKLSFVRKYLYFVRRLNRYRLRRNT